MPAQGIAPTQGPHETRTQAAGVLRAPPHPLGQRGVKRRREVRENRAIFKADWPLALYLQAQSAIEIEAAGYFAVLNFLGDFTWQTGGW